MCTSPGAPYTMVDGSWISKVFDCVQGVVMGLGFTFRVLGDGGWCSTVLALKVPRERQASSLAFEQLCLLPFLAQSYFLLVRIVSLRGKEFYLVQPRKRNLTQKDWAFRCFWGGALVCWSSCGHLGSDEV